jgi:flavin reductase (DIM6/NTAB) family NADH-FMN oxidoreductase RutF
MIQKITSKELQEMDARFRVNFVNSLNGFKSGNLIATQNAEGQPNLAIFSSVVHLGSNPPLLGYIQRPDSVSRHTFENIQSTEKFTINAIHSEMISQAHQTSARYPAEVSEFSAVGLTPEYLPGFETPFVKESNLKMALKLKEIIPIPSNNTLLVIGEIEAVFFPEYALHSDGFVNHAELNSIAIGGLDAYFKTEKLARFSYAKPDQKIQQI